MKLTTLLLLPFLAFAPPNKVEIKQHLEYHEHIRLKLNKILEIPEGRNYWEREYQTKPFEDKLKNYLK